MSKNSDFNFNEEFKDIGNFTRYAVKGFEQNIVSQTDYIEKVEIDYKNRKNNK